MTDEQFRGWLDEMKKQQPGLTDTRCARLLGISRRTIIRYKECGAGLTIALACNALLKNIGPYDR